jgi:hypothetical protein
MFILHHASEPVPSYQTTRCANYTPLPLTDLQWFLLACCACPMMLADLAWAAQRPVQEVEAALDFLQVHGLVHIAAPAVRARYTR